MCGCQAGCCEICATTGEAGKKNGQGRCDGGRTRAQWMEECRHCGNWKVRGWTSCVARMDWHLDPGYGPTQHSQIWTAATIAPLDCGPKKPEPGQQMQQPCPWKLRPIALAEVLMKLAESCVIEQHIERLLREVEPTNLGLGSPDAAAFIVRLV